MSTLEKRDVVLYGDDLDTPDVVEGYFAKPIYVGVGKALEQHSGSGGS